MRHKLFLSTKSGSSTSYGASKHTGKTKDNGCFVLLFCLFWSGLLCVCCFVHVLAPQIQLWCWQCASYYVCIIIIIICEPSALITSHSNRRVLSSHTMKIFIWNSYSRTSASYRSSSSSSSSSSPVEIRGFDFHVLWKQPITLKD